MRTNSRTHTRTRIAERIIYSHRRTVCGRRQAATRRLRCAQCDALLLSPVCEREKKTYFLAGTSQWAATAWLRLRPRQLRVASIQLNLRATAAAAAAAAAETAVCFANFANVLPQRQQQRLLCALLTKSQRQLQSQLQLQLLLLQFLLQL